MVIKLTKVQNERLELLINKERKWFEDDHNKIILLARTVPILILGDHPENKNEINVMNQVTKKLQEKYYFAIPLKDVSKKGNHIHCERNAIKHSSVVIKLENKENSNPGSVGENVLIACDKECQEKTFLFVKKSPKIEDKVFSIDYYYLYFPRIIFCKDDKDMINKAEKLAIREAFRLTYLSENNPDKGKTTINYISNEMLNKYKHGKF